MQSLYDAKAEGTQHDFKNNPYLHITSLSSNVQYICGNLWHIFGLNKVRESIKKKRGNDQTSEG